MRRGEQQGGRPATALSTVRAAWRPVLGAALVAGLLVGAASALADEVWTTSTQVVLSGNQEFDPLGTGSYVEPTRFVSTQVTVMSSGPVVEAAAAVLDDGTTTDELAAAVSVSASATGDVIVVQARGDSAQQAADRVDAVVAGYEEVVTTVVAEEADAAAAASADPVQVASIRVAQGVYGDGVAIADDATPPASPAAPRPLRNALVAALLGALAAAGWSLLRRGAPTGGADALARAADAPVLGDVPVPAQREVSAGGAQAPTVAEAAMAAAALAHLTSGQPATGHATTGDATTGHATTGHPATGAPAGGVVVVSGARPGSSSASAALGLARASAQTRGLRVLLVDADGRGQEVLRHRGALAPRTSVDALVDPAVPTADAVARVGPGTGTTRGQLSLATHGGENGAPDRGAALVPVLRRLAGEFDLVVVRTGAIASDPVALALLAAADHLVLVAGPRTGAQDVRVAVDRAAVAGLACTGLLLTHRRPRRSEAAQDPGALPPAAGSSGRPAPTADGRGAPPAGAAG